MLFSSVQAVVTAVGVAADVVAEEAVAVVSWIIL